MSNLMDENSSLRSLNMSLIYEREKLLRELRQCDSEMVSMQRTVDGLLQSSSQPGPGKDNNAALCQGFRLLCNKLVAVLAPVDPALKAADVLLVCSRKLPSFKVPQDVCFVPNLPKSASGKENKPRCETLIKVF